MEGQDGLATQDFDREDPSAREGWATWRQALLSLLIALVRGGAGPPHSQDDARRDSATGDSKTASDKVVSILQQRDRIENDVRAWFLSFSTRGE